MSIQCRIGDDRIARVVIDHVGRRNALTYEMFSVLAELWPRLSADPRVRCVIVTGAGEDAFCAGADLSVDFSRHPDIDDLVNQALLKTCAIRKPIVAAINGACVAGGFELMLSCDLRAAVHGSRFGLPEVRWGIFPSGGAAMKLARQIPYARAMEMLLIGRLIDAEEARDLGLIGRVLPSHSALQEWAEDTARVLSANSPAALQATKRFAGQMHTADCRRWAEVEAALVTEVRGTEQVNEGISAFLEKRAPEYGEMSAEFMSGVHDPE